MRQTWGCEWQGQRRLLESELKAEGLRQELLKWLLYLLHELAFARTLPDGGIGQALARLRQALLN